MNSKCCLFFISFLVFFLISCSPKLSPNKASVSTEKIFYPKDADTAYFQLLKGITSNADFISLSKFQEAILGKQKPLWIRKPYGITVTKNKIYIADISLNGLDIIDLKNNEFTQFKPYHRNLEFILTVDVDENGDRYIVDSNNMKVFVYDLNGKFKTVFDVPENKRPIRIRVRNDKIYMADLISKKINIYDKNTFKLIDQLPKNVTYEDEGYIYMPMDFDITDEYIYVIDSGAWKVKIYTHEGKLVKSFGGQGNDFGLFVRPKSIAVDKEGNILVLDSTTRLIQIFNSNGDLLTLFGYPYQIDEYKFASALMVPTQMVIDYNNLEYFKPYVDPKYNLKYLVYVINQKGNGLLKVYGRIELKN